MDLLCCVCFIVTAGYGKIRVQSKSDWEDLKSILSMKKEYYTTEGLVEFESEYRIQKIGTHYRGFKRMSGVCCVLRCIDMCRYHSLHSRLLPSFDSLVRWFFCLCQTTAGKVCVEPKRRACGRAQRQTVVCVNRKLGQFAFRRPQTRAVRYYVGR
jgi:hypothetical protein